MTAAVINLVSQNPEDGEGIDENEGKIDVQILRGMGYVWKLHDLMRLRKEYRILGSVVGSGARHPREEPGLPLILNPQEIQILQEAGAVRLVENSVLQTPPSQEIINKAKQYRELHYQKQVQIFKKEKEKNILSFADRIIEGKKKKLINKLKKKKQMALEQTGEQIEDVKDDITFDRDELIREELEKIKPISRDHQVIQIFTEDPWRGDMVCPAPWEYPEGDVNKCRLLAFRALWKGGYYVGEGSKFGGDFLVYVGDPVRFHAKYIVLCIGEEESRFSRPQDIVSKSRLGNQVRKIVLVAELKDGKVEFHSYSRNTDNKPRFPILQGRNYAADVSYEDHLYDHEQRIDHDDEQRNDQDEDRRTGPDNEQFDDYDPDQEEL